MLPPPPELLDLSARRGRELALQAAAERLRPHGIARLWTAAVLRRLADRVAPADPALDGPLLTR